MLVINFKTNGTKQFFSDYLSVLKSYAVKPDHTLRNLVLCPPFPYISQLSAQEHMDLQTGGQDCLEDGLHPCTGSVTASMLADVGATWVIIGHSERRVKQGETSRQIQKKITAALQAGLGVIVCVGEEQTARQQNTMLQVLTEQITACLPQQPIPENRFCIAYEPVWAIGADAPPTKSQIDAACGHMQKILQEKGQRATILYGGSVNANNAFHILGGPVQGLLVGRAGLHAEDVCAMLQGMQ